MWPTAKYVSTEVAVGLGSAMFCHAPPSTWTWRRYAAAPALAGQLYLPGAVVPTVPPRNEIAGEAGPPGMTVDRAPVGIPAAMSAASRWAVVRLTPPSSPGVALYAATVERLPAGS